MFKTEFVYIRQVIHSDVSERQLPSGAVFQSKFV